MGGELTMNIEACTLIELALSGTVKKYKLPKSTELDGKRTKSIVTYSSGKTEAGATLADPGNAYLRLKRAGDTSEPIKIPLRSLLYSPAYPPLQFQRLEGVFDWENSSVEFADAPTAGTVLQLLVVYNP
ncbi:MAG: hypothetical protein NW241_10850 [Bacteroidia bacterium]|nr:hypothetical protein [Bacteroidia bacterium]